MSEENIQTVIIFYPEEQKTAERNASRRTWKVSSGYIDFCNKKCYIINYVLA